MRGSSKKIIANFRSHENNAVVCASSTHKLEETGAIKSRERERSRATKASVKMMAVNRFGISRTDLKVLMSQRKEDAVKELEKYEGVESIAEQLETNFKTGLSGTPQDLESRRNVYGINQLPQNPPKSFIALCLDAIQDPTLIILICAAILSIALGVGVELRKVRGCSDVHVLFLLLIQRAVCAACVCMCAVLCCAVYSLHECLHVHQHCSINIRHSLSLSLSLPLSLFITRTLLGLKDLLFLLLL